MTFNRNPKRRERYDYLRGLGFSAREATFLKDRNDAFIATCVNELSNMGNIFDLSVVRMNKIKKLAEEQTK